MQTNAVQILAFLAVPGFFVAFYLIPKYAVVAALPAQMWVIVPDRYFFVSYSMAVMGFVTVFEWDVLFPDRRDGFRSSGFWACTNAAFGTGCASGVPAPFGDRARSIGRGVPVVSADLCDRLRTSRQKVARDSGENRGRTGPAANIMGALPESLRAPASGRARHLPFHQPEHHAQPKTSAVSGNLWRGRRGFRPFHAVRIRLAK